MGGSSPNSDYNYFFGNVVSFCIFCVVFMFSIFSKKKNWIGGLLVGIWLFRVFLGFLDFLNLTRPLNVRVSCVTNEHEELI